MSQRHLLVLALWLGITQATHASAETHELMEMSLDELMQLEVTSVSRKSQRLSDAAAAVFVINRDEIRRSGATSIADALRLVPGLQVARIDANKWAISSRGFNGRFANKLQVLMDGRSVYTPTFSGVYWEAQDTVLEDIERIEVIRGPGAAMWGANAVNGVINIITRSARETQGGQLTFGGGTFEKRFGSLRYGSQLDERTYGRVFMKGFARGDFDAQSRQSGNDAWQSYRGGFRVDRRSDFGDLTLQGDLYRSDLSQTIEQPSMAPPTSLFVPSPAAISGFNLLGRWRRLSESGSESIIQAHYDHTYRNEAFLTEERDTIDLDGQYRFRLTDNQEVIVGLNYRWTRDAFSDHFPVRFDDAYHTRQLISSFAQDEITLLPDRLKLTFGAKLEYNQFTGVEGQPNVRLMWTPTSAHSIWAAISRAVRTPSRAEDSAQLDGYVLAATHRLNPLGVPVLVTGIGNGKFRSEVLWAYELGYRFNARPDFSADIALFYNDYSSLRSNEGPNIRPRIANFGRYVQFEMPFGNYFAGNTYGAEFSIDWRPLPYWRWQVSYSYLGMNLHATGRSIDPGAPAIEGASPQQQFSVRTGIDLGADVQFDLGLRFVDRLLSAGFPGPDSGSRIPSYLTLDARLAWRPIKSVELSIVGQNLLDPRHPEFRQELFAPLVSEVPRSVYGKLSIDF